MPGPGYQLVLLRRPVCRARYPPPTSRLRTPAQVTWDAAALTRSPFPAAHAGGFQRRAAYREAKSLKDLGLISEYSIKNLGKAGGAKSSAESAVVYYLHVGSYKQKDNAEKKVEMLENHDCRAVVVEEEISGATWYRIYLGEFKDEEEARRVGSKLRDRVVISYFKPVPINKKALTAR